MESNSGKCVLNTQRYLSLCEVNFIVSSSIINSNGKHEESLVKILKGNVIYLFYLYL